jgi:hypothetical protein
MKPAAQAGGRPGVILLRSEPEPVAALGWPHCVPLLTIKLRSRLRESPADRCTDTLLVVSRHRQAVYWPFISDPIDRYNLLIILCYPSLAG